MSVDILHRSFTSVFSRRLLRVNACSPVMNPVRMSSTFVGSSGRTYTRHGVLYVHPQKPEHGLHLAVSGKKRYVLKPVSSSIFELLQEFNDVFGADPRLRTHVDHNEEEKVLVYEYFKSDLLALVKNYPALPLTARKRILYEVGRALNTMHQKNWIHLDVKPDNVFLNWYVDEKDVFRLQKVALGDMDCTLELVEGIPLNAMIGNVMWRSPEGQLGKGIGKHSEVFSFGLLCLFVITGAEWLHPDFDSLETDPEPVILYRLLTAFGPLPETLVSTVDDEFGEALLRGLWQEIIDEKLFDPFEHWQEKVFPNLDHEAKRLISSMTRLDPTQRLSISEVLEDPYWKGAIDLDVDDVEDSTKN